jgi:uncharacterized protein YjbJ (UPF0337 family)
MDQDIIQGKWKQLGGRLRETWGRLTDDDLAEENGDREYVIAKVQAHYGYSKEQAQQVVRDFEKTL